MNESQSRWSVEQFGAWVASLDGDITTIPAQDVWLAAMERAWMREPLLEGNLQAKIAELEERLATIGGQHALMLHGMEATIQRQAGQLQQRDQQIAKLQGEVESWRNKLDAQANQFRAALEEMVAPEDLEEAVQQEREKTQAVCEAKYRVELQKAIEHEMALRDTLVASHRQIMAAEYEKSLQQHREADRKERLGLTDTLGAEIRRLTFENQELLQKTEKLEQVGFQQITEFTDRFLADDEYRKSVLEDRINTRIDQGVIILKGMVALELRKKPDTPMHSLDLPSEDDFDAWWSSIHWSGGPDLLDWDAMARRAWEEALSRVKLT